MQPEQGHRGHDLHRFLTFVDACIAIAVTLLVLPLVDAAGDVGDVGLDDFLRDHQGQFWAFLLSFVVIAQIWNGHHRYASQIAETDSTVTRCVLAWTLCLVLLPFPTALISQYDSRSGIVPLYVGLLLLNALCSAALALHVSRTPGLWKDGVTAADVSPVGSLVMAGCYAIALVLGTAVPAINFYALILLVLADPITNRLRRART